MDCFWRIAPSADTEAAFSPEYVEGSFSEVRVVPARHQSRWSVGRNKTSLTFIRSGWARDQRIPWATSTALRNSTSLKESSLRDLKISGLSRARSAATTTFKAALKSSGASWLGAGRGIWDPCVVLAEACGGLASPLQSISPLPNPRISPVTSRLGVVCRLSKPHS